MYCIFLPYFRITRVEPQASAVACVAPVVQHLFERIEPGTIGFTRIGTGPTITMLIDGFLTFVVDISRRAFPREFRCTIGIAHVCTPVTTAHPVCRLLLEKTNTPSHNEHTD